MAETAFIDTKSVSELAGERFVRECTQWFTREKQWINERHLELCRIPAPTFLEEQRAEWMTAQFRALGCDSRIDRAGNVIAHAFGRKEGPYIALTAHLDTVLSPRNAEDIRVSPDGKFLGPGVSDNGAGLAGLLAVTAALRSCVAAGDLQGSLLVVANVGEEGEGNLSGMRYLCRQSSLASKIKGFVVLDGPAVDHITNQALASRRFEVTINGPGGHSWSDYGTGNPVHALCRAISMLTEYRLNGGTPGPRSTINFGTIDGGLSINSIPTVARAKVDIRSESPEKIEELANLLTAAVERSLETENERSSGPRVSAKIREIGSRPGGRMDEAAQILRYTRAVDAHLSIRSHLDCASTDANIPLSMGIPAVSIGAGGQGGGAHTPSEWYHPEGRDFGLRRILLLLLMLLRDPPEIA